MSETANDLGASGRLVALVTLHSPSVQCKHPCDKFTQMCLVVITWAGAVKLDWLRGTVLIDLHAMQCMLPKESLSQEHSILPRCHHGTE